MQKIELTPEQSSALRTLHRSTKDRKKADRIKAILLLHRGFSVKETAELLLLDEGTVAIIRDRFLSDCIDGFLNDSYAPYAGKLTDAQKEAVRTFVRENLVLDTMTVIEFAKASFGVAYTRSGMTDLLHSLNFTYKKTKLVPSKANAFFQKLHVWRYRIVRLLMTEKEIMYFIDGVHPLHNAVSSYGWIEKGTEKEIRANTGRNRVNLNGAYCLEEQEAVTVESESVNAQSTIELYRKLEEKHPEKETIHVVRDNARYYANKEVQEYLKTSRIREMPLPPYSPNLNPIERLWLFMKKNLLYSKYYEHFSDFREAIRKFFGEDFHLYREKLKTFITGNFHMIGS
jgi:transposase